MTKDILVIGLCGRSGSGKGYVCERFSAFGIPSVDTDKVYREILEKEGSQCLAELVAEFGKDILSEGKLDRRALSAIVFAPGNENKLERLNAITHKYILSETNERIESYKKNGCRAVLVDAPVLFESGFDSICDFTLCVTAPDSVCVERICARDSRTKEEALSRLANQKSADELRRLCSFEIVNDGEADVLAQVLEVINKLGAGGKDEE
ncbi:MAG: dephospho-CoA kinase [Ruminococcaceae bacterium]|nr:dephospho-CoA kinase [Oscillospiraceae bacterium]